MNERRRTREDLILYCALAIQGPLEKVVIPTFLRATGVRVNATFDATAVLSSRIEAGERPDVFIGMSETVNRLVSLQLVENNSRTSIADASIGVGIADGASRPNIDTVDELVHTLLRARSVAYSRSGASGIYLAKLLEQLGIGKEVGRKATIIERGYAGSAIVDGRADLAIQQISELRFIPEVQIVGPLPASVQRKTNFVACVIARDLPNNSASRQRSLTLVEHLAGDEARGAYLLAGLDLPDSP